MSTFKELSFLDRIALKVAIEALYENMKANEYKPGWFGTNNFNYVLDCENMKELKDALEHLLY
ncbi:MAG: hypothetical protein WC389_05480 [Lutibacter sp.]|jgi:ribose 5-phosphate isomerase